nr:MAG TPA: hypothetical protein [Caudoviricetes sp.]
MAKSHIALKDAFSSRSLNRPSLTASKALHKI